MDRIFAEEIERLTERLAGVAGARSGSVACPQLFGGSLNVHPHLHTLAADGVFEKTDAGGVRFHEDPPPSADDVAEVARRVRDRAVRWLRHRGYLGIIPGVRSSLHKDFILPDDLLVNDPAVLSWSPYYYKDVPGFTYRIYMNTHLIAESTDTYRVGYYTTNLAFRGHVLRPGKNTILFELVSGSGVVDFESVILFFRRGPSHVEARPK
jgi:hypothetical protein